MFPSYVNSLKLKDKNGKVLTLDKDGNGSFKEEIKRYYIDSANKALANGTDLSSFEFLTIQDGKVIDLDYDKYIAYMGKTEKHREHLIMLIYLQEKIIFLEIKLLTINILQNI